MSKIVILDVENIGGNPNSAALRINENGDNIETAFENTLSRDGTGPNQMEAQLDMNDNRIINLGAPVELTDAARLMDVTGTINIAALNPVGGTDGQVLTKLSATDYDYDWQDPAVPTTGVVESIVGTVNQIDVDSADPANPIVSLAASVLATLALATSSVQPGDNISDLVNNAGYITAASLPSGANPTASVGLSAVNGSALTFMRSDAAPPISQSIAPTWSAIHTFSQVPVVPDDSWAYGKIQNVSATNRILGRITSGAGDIEELTGANVLTILGIGAGANPTASVGLTAVNGSAVTYMRSDGAPALSVAIAPSWSANHNWLDNAEIKMGTGLDLRIYHDGTNNSIRTDNGEIRLQGGTTVAARITAAGQFLFANGTLGTLGWGFVSEPTLGAYRVGTGQFGVVCGGTEVIRYAVDQTTSFLSKGTFVHRVSGTTNRDYHIRPTSGNGGFISWTEDAVADRWNVGIATGNSGLLFRSGSVASNTLRATLTSGGNWQLNGDSQEVQVGASQDFRMYHDGTDSILRNDTGILKINQSTNSAIWINASRAVGFGGANYGNSGDVLVSQGSGAVPVWSATAGINRVYKVSLPVSTSSMGTDQISPAVTGTPSGPTYASTNALTRIRTTRWTAAVAANSTAGVRLNTTNEGVNGTDGYRVRLLFGSTVTNAGQRVLIGMSDNSAMGTADPSARTDMFAFGKDAADTNLQLMVNDNAGTCTKTDLGFTYQSVQDVLLEAIFSTPAGGTTLTYSLRNLNSNTVLASGTVSSNIPAATTCLVPHIDVNNAASGIAITLQAALLEVGHNLP